MLKIILLFLCILQQLSSFRNNIHPEPTPEPNPPPVLANPTTVAPTGQPETVPTIEKSIPPPTGPSDESASTNEPTEQGENITKAAPETSHGGGYTHKSDQMTQIIAILVVFGALLVVALIVIVCVRYRRKKKDNNDENFDGSGLGPDPDSFIDHQPYPHSMDRPRSRWERVSARFVQRQHYSRRQRPDSYHQPTSRRAPDRAQASARRDQESNRRASNREQQSARSGHSARKDQRSAVKPTDVSVSVPKKERKKHETPVESSVSNIKPKKKKKKDKHGIENFSEHCVGAESSIKNPKNTAKKEKKKHQQPAESSERVAASIKSESGVSPKKQKKKGKPALTKATIHESTVSPSTNQHGAKKGAKVKVKQQEPDAAYMYASTTSKATVKCMPGTAYESLSPKSTRVHPKPGIAYQSLSPNVKPGNRKK